MTLIAACGLKSLGLAGLVLLDVAEQFSQAISRADVQVFYR